MNFSKIHFALPDFLALVPPQLFCQKPPALFPLAPPWLKTVRANIEVAQPRSAKVPGNLHVQWYNDAMEDVNEEEVGQLVDPEDFGGGEKWDVVLVQSCKKWQLCQICLCANFQGLLKPDNPLSGVQKSQSRNQSWP